MLPTTLESSLHLNIQIFADQALTLLRDQLSGMVLGVIFLFIGLAACGMALIRRRIGVRLLVWFGLFSAMYGLRMLARVPPLTSSVATVSAGVDTAAIITYLIMIPALLFWLELSIGKLRLFLQVAAIAASVLGFIGVCSVFVSDDPYRLTQYSDVLVMFVLVVLAIVISVPAMATKFGIMRSRVSAIGTLVLALTALYENFESLRHRSNNPLLEPLAFAVFVFSLGYVAASKMFADERKLLTIENELAIAREIQSSILPTSVPDALCIRISAAYVPMTAVAGDFYEFISVDQNRCAILVADVSGHGVPAALIAAMIKVAMQSVAKDAHDPGEVLRGLNQILSGQLKGQLISAAYLWLDTESGIGLYSAAGHPPLLCWRNEKLERIESNGLLIGVMKNARFPVRELTIASGDRFLLYTDGVTEPENSAGEAFGEQRLEQVMRANESKSPAQFSNELLREIGRWQPASLTQQDDITIVVVDIVKPRSGDCSTNAQQGELLAT